MSVYLPIPWEDRVFTTDCLGAVSYLVGPNGSGKSQFAKTLFKCLKGYLGGGRFFGTDRLSEMAMSTAIHRKWAGDKFASGFDKKMFSVMRAAGEEGSGIDTIVLLEERMDLRIQIEATLRHPFDREVSLEWDSGRLLPTVGRRNGELYEAVRNLPSKTEVDIDPVLRNHLSSYIFELQRTVANNPGWQIDQVKQRLSEINKAWEDVFQIQQFDPDSDGGFKATIGIVEMIGQQERAARVNDETDAGRGDFEIEPVQLADENIQ